MALPKVELPEEAVRAGKFFFSYETWMNFGMFMLRIILIIVIAAVVVKIGKILINRLFNLKLKGPIRKNERREKTLLRLLENTIAYVVYFSAILAILTEFSIDVKGLLAGAGVLGLAVGFGAQSLVKDVISGFFILFEDQFSVGDYVQIGSALGTVDEIGLRTSKIIAYGGEVYIIPNGTISEVINYSINNSLVILDVAVAYELDIDHVEKLINEFLVTLPKERYEELVGEPEVLGIQNLSATDVVIRITAETLPVMNYAVARKLRKDLKSFMDAHDIEMPYPKMVTYQRSK